MRVIIFIICCFLINYTGHQLYKMAQLRGWRPGATITTHVVTRKWTEPDYRYFEDHYLIKWEDSNRFGYDDTNIPPRIWRRLKVGDTVRIAKVGKDTSPYLYPDDIFADNGNFVFDILLMLLWVGGAGYQVYRFIRHQEL